MWTFPNLKHDSWVLANQSSFMTALHFSERFVAWKRDSWASANQRHCWTALHIFQLSHPETTILNISKSALLHDGTAIFWKFRVLKMTFPTISKHTRLQLDTFHIWTFCSLETEFVNISRTTTFQDSTTVWSLNQQIEPLALRHSPRLKVMLFENRIR